MTSSVAIATCCREFELESDYEEQRYVDRARQGDSEAIRWLLDRYRERVVRLATHILRHPSEAEDVAQEAFVKAFRNLKGYRSDARFYTWLYQIVVRVCLDRRRLGRWDKELQLEELPEFDGVPDPGHTATDSRMLVESLLDRLSPPMRAMIVLRELEGLEYEEIARALQIPIGLVRWRLHTARGQFQKLWSEARLESANV